MGRGSGNSYIESQLRPGEATGEKRQCNTLAGITIQIRPQLYAYD